jgi:hypothetical protein
MIVDDVQYLPAETSQAILGNSELLEETQAIYNRFNSHNKDAQRVEFIMEDDGLGPLPIHLSSIGSMLLFNSKINPYKNYQTLDNLMSSGRVRTAGEEKAKGLESAPTTIMSGDALPDIQAPNLLFKPAMGEMGNIALPDNLPLDFIASKALLRFVFFFFNSSVVSQISISLQSISCSPSLLPCRVNLISYYPRLPMVG